MAKITNTASGPRGVRTSNGLVMVEPGQTVDVDLAKGEELYEGLVEGAGGFDNMTKAELIAHMDERGIAHDDGDNKSALLAKIEAANASQ
jgi:hypothetical protein